MATDRCNERSSRPPDPTPPRYRKGVRGTRLRHAALAVLIRARGAPLSVREIWRSIELDHVIAPGITRKHMADGLRHECRRGRAIRVEHGYYVVGTIAPRTRHRILAHERELRFDDTTYWAELFASTVRERELRSVE